ncbi:NAD dependent epimerase/dehydratase family protein [Myxococcus stipitatus DSM 14675]|uniref:NAD dependent epimerase/dehydratase family protein n=1 Tax=Myxococcus stipitatus (strain DSM 14675 / JCM 12634 / Mx s8) TaxID=1278073 RepID=L7UB82_MYXSD|nr:SDR family oxidoreductase [Myxococcus stipitatus]AGC46161.1 NAD dependent epimerase/dehydratase family protein [Myxococcus stipitatus DSM 14675]
MDTELKGKGVLVTGGAGGIGTALVRAFSGEGAKVAVHYRSREAKAKQLAEEVGGAAVGADLTVEAEVDALVPASVAALGRLDVLVCNAGVWPSPDVPVWEMSLERWRRTLAENLDSVFLCCRGFLRHVATTGVGTIVIISSTAGLFGEAGHSDYAAAKGAIAGGFLRSLKNELGRIAPLGRVNVVCPGWTEVDRNRDKLGGQGFVKRVTRTMPLRKVGQPEDVARVVVSLASDFISGHVTGEVVTVAGGMEGRVLHDD